MTPELLVIRCAPDVAHLLGAERCPEPVTKLVMFSPTSEAFVWDTRGGKWRWKLVPTGVRCIQ